jgi:hypothetical protein
VGGVTTNNATVRFFMQSNLTLQVTFMDVARPTNTITAPTANQRVSNAVFMVKGTAKDNAQVAGVWSQLNGGGWALADSTNGWTNWTAEVTLNPGTNVVKAYTVDATGNRSATNSRSFVYVVTGTLRSSAVLLSPQVTGITLAGTTATVSFAGVTGLTYTLEYKDALHDSSWTPLPASVSGTDGILSLTDSNTPPASRFYRIRAQLPPRE